MSKPEPRPTLSLAEIRRQLQSQGQAVSPEQLQALKQFLETTGGVSKAQAVLQTLGRLKAA